MSSPYDPEHIKSSVDRVRADIERLKTLLELQKFADEKSRQKSKPGKRDEALRAGD